MFYIFYVKILKHLKNDSFLFPNYLLYFTLCTEKKRKAYKHISC